MRNTITVLAVLGLLLLAGGATLAAENPIDAVKKACNTELTTFCKGVKPGDGRVLACLYAFEDQVSDKCTYAVYNAAAELEQAINALKFAATQCKDDLLKYCGDVQVGEGRGLACLEKNEKTVSQACKDALKQTGLKK
ncbi:MAG: cysteine rich repeat-containing protein [Acidobacteria bacterium]|nr:cysteine rich repeat-containing protein [Acidobacteriota bacterium]MCU0253167.1 cysteine rich repeat-containing protein [Acidobacteriota bacterium]